jgi:hypothetical protein
MVSNSQNPKASIHSRVVVCVSRELCAHPAPLAVHWSCTQLNAVSVSLLVHMQANKKAFVLNLTRLWFLETLASFWCC